MRKTIDGPVLAVGVLLAVLSGGMLFLPFGLAFLYVLHERHEEIKRGELDDAQKF